MTPLGAVKRLVPRPLRRQYHHLLAFIASWIYGRPSRHLVVICVTGTDGKTTTATMIASVLAAAGALVGLSTTAIVQVGDRRWLNETHMTMPGRMALQRLLRQMVGAGCRYAVLEVSSEGLTQYRHIGIDFDVAVVTNVTPEHLDAHGSLEAYRHVKGLLFNTIIRGGDKRFSGQAIPKITVVNLDDPTHDYFLKFWAEAHYGTSLNQPPELTIPNAGKITTLYPMQVNYQPHQSEMTVDGHRLTVNLPGEYNVRNALQAAAVGRGLGLDWATIAAGLSQVKMIPGRGEEIVTHRPWRVVVDYALTPAALREFYKSLIQSGAWRIIAVFGAAGGGRDKWKRPELGKIAAQYCEKIILTTDDPYNENPSQIADEIKQGVPPAETRKVETVLDRHDAIQRAMKLAQPGDVVAITGMGSETSMMVKDQRVAWNDAQVARELLAKPA